MANFLRAILTTACAFATLAVPTRAIRAAEPAAPQPPAAAVAPRPNVVFVLADDLGYGDIGCYGQKRIKTPTIDRMAAEGTRFTQMYAGATVCSPSRATLMTGLHNGHCWIRANDARNLRRQDAVVPEVLKSVGYSTALIGKWGIGQAGSDGVPNKKGFDFFYGYLNNGHAHNHYPSFLWRDDVKESLPNEQATSLPSGAGVASKRVVYSTDKFADESLAWIEKNKANPFFLYLAFTVPHANNEAKLKGMEVPDHGEYANTDWPDSTKGQAAMVTRMDAHIGRVLAKLKELGLDEKTLVIFTSDNGPHREGGNDPDFNDSNGPLTGIKRDLTDGGIREPFVARWPGKVPAGVVSDHVAGFQDVLVTLAELAGAKDVPPTDGVSFAPTLLGKPAAEQKKHDYLYWEFHEGGFGQAVRLGDWKAIRTTRARSTKAFDANGGVPPSAATRPAKTELYDLTKDLGEEHDVAAEHPDLVAKVEQIMKDARTPWEPLRAPAATQRTGAKKESEKKNGAAKEKDSKEKEPGAAPTAE